MIVYWQSGKHTLEVRAIKIMKALIISWCTSLFLCVVVWRLSSALQDEKQIRRLKDLIHMQEMIRLNHEALQLEHILVRDISREVCNVCFYKPEQHFHVVEYAVKQALMKIHHARYFK
jgi:hypothetical protein